MVKSSYSLVTVTFELLGSVNLPVVARHGNVDLFAGTYALQRFELGRMLNSIKSDQNAILNFYRFCESLNIDLHARVADQVPFTISEIEAFAAYCSVNHKDNTATDAGWYQSKFRGGKKFFMYLWQFYRDRLSNSLDVLHASDKLHSRMTAAFDLYKKAPYRTCKKDKIGLTPALQEQFIRIINPSASNEKNPWKTQKIRWRNYILLLLLMLNGNRKGETLLLRLNNFQLTGQRKYYDILKNTNRDTYPRAESPSVKTFGRQIELHDDLAVLIEYYITKIRNQFISSHKTSYIFISYRDGLPLSVHTPNAILADVVAAFPEFEGLLSPHRLRNTFHDILNEALDQKFKSHSGLSRQIMKSAIQENAGGWKHNSQMPEKYAKGSIQKCLASFQQQIQERLLQHSRNISTAGDGIA